jgi:hypothetical protein
MKGRTLLVILILAGFPAEVIHSQPLTLSEGLRLDYGQLVLALDLLHKRADRHRLCFNDHTFHL